MLVNESDVEVVTEVLVVVVVVVVLDEVVVVLTVTLVEVANSSTTLVEVVLDVSTDVICANVVLVSVRVAVGD